MAFGRHLCVTDPKQALEAVSAVCTDLARHNEDGTPQDGVSVDVNVGRHRLCVHVAGFRT